MSEEIGKISKPQADNVQLKRKLYLVQNIQNYFPGNKDFENLLLEYWNSISDQLDNLEKTAGTINYIYIEGMYQEYDVASKLLNENNKWCLNTIDSRIKSGSNYKKIEDENNYKELIDWTRIAQLGFVSENAKEVTEKNYTNIITERSKIIHDELNGLNEGEAALFIISSGSHKFPDDMEIFNVIPPSLDKMNRWITENQNNLQQKNEKEVQNEGEQDKQSGLWTP
ncbi:MAG: hypothetical protein VYD40_02245 [Chloroflexota bacterium]|jgi:hypothetical protein|nr:hypothetical protein [Chloroflexota bacterium]MEC8440591.1 hypothetical protein [Chloroflexota bacterium]MEC8749986.1 hypothetical protein [Chloroflexota bacterium]MEE2620593.1 hypothetical protein [Chloroflexota bacterium]|tara:strand:+ start:1465 stop:2142 length:678 start_codon:yes stop_codon:yes gene_type:complete